MAEIASSPPRLVLAVDAYGTLFDTGTGSVDATTIETSTTCSRPRDSDSPSPTWPRCSRASNATPGW